MTGEEIAVPAQAPMVLEQPPVVERFRVSDDGVPLHERRVDCPRCAFYQVNTLGQPILAWHFCWRDGESVRVAWGRLVQTVTIEGI